MGCFIHRDAQVAGNEDESKGKGGDTRAQKCMIRGWEEIVTVLQGDNGGGGKIITGSRSKCKGMRDRDC